MKGKEKFTRPFNLSLYLSSTVSKDVYKRFTRSIQRNKPLKWRDLFDKFYICMHGLHKKNIASLTLRTVRKDVLYKRHRIHKDKRNKW